MDRWQYLGVLAACLAVTAPLEFMGAGVYRRLPALVRAVTPVVVVFGVWDLVAIARGHWDFDHALTLGFVVFGAMPVEEVLFFVVVPLCAVLTYEAVLALPAVVRRRVGRAARG
ncbi:lycopene cyclase domain-containing protein [Saccharothrix obliqua]|uniref:lycopene cyclase domain-containing protein n=1 Tax=Saccharothrix obliqua TaxID=2861747 RepID=UPI001C5D25DD|nr:lycopene cyclase domain-containing protein [Saccharothrix obliqua]MBW4718185.1 lycopene cyclase domain-containing protein [Saccharothrix obliqua]